MQFFLAVETHERIGAAGWLDILDLDFFNLLGARGSLACLRLVGCKAAHEILQLGDLVLGLRIHRQLLRTCLRRCQHVVVVIAGVNLQCAVIHIGHVGTYLVQEMAIMGNDDHGRIALVQHIFEPADGVDIEVIGRLVEQQDIRIRKQCLRQQDAQLPAWCDVAHRALVLIDRNAHAQQQFAGARFGGITVVFGKPGFQVGRLHVVVVGGFGIGIDRIALGHRCPHFSVAHHHHVEYPHFFKRKLILTQFTQTLVLIQHHVAGRRLEIAAQDLHERRLATAVRADQTVAVTVAEFD